MKVHYFDEEEADPNDHLLKMAKLQGYVPRNCLLAGKVVISIINSHKDPCDGCAGPREKCGGRG